MTIYAKQAESVPARTDTEPTIPRSLRSFPFCTFPAEKTNHGRHVSYSLIHNNTWQIFRIEFDSLTPLLLITVPSALDRLRRVHNESP